VGFVRAAYQRVAGLDAALRCVGELSAHTAIFDVEVCFATNSARRPQAVPECAGARVVYLASAGKPVRIAPYQGFPRPGVVVGDQIATDGLLARRLGYAFVDYRPPLDEIPAGPRLLRQLGQLVRPVAFSRPVRSSR
jgi:hypothetical protein